MEFVIVVMVKVEARNQQQAIEKLVKKLESVDLHTLQRAVFKLPKGGETR